MAKFKKEKYSKGLYIFLCRNERQFDFITSEYDYEYGHFNTEKDESYALWVSNGRMISHQGTLYDGRTAESYVREEYKEYTFVEVSELIQDYQPITPKVGEKYRVLKKLKIWYGEPISSLTDLKIRDIDIDQAIVRVIHECGENYAIHNDCLTTEYLEKVKEECECGETDYPSREDMRRMMIWGGWEDVPREEIKKETIKLTTMQKLTSALKRLLSKEQQSLYKAGYINQGLELSSEGKDFYISALYRNNGEHGKAVAEMVEQAEEDIKEDEA